MLRAAEVARRCCGCCNRRNIIFTGADGCAQPPLYQHRLQPIQLLRLQRSGKKQLGKAIGRGRKVAVGREGGGVGAAPEQVSAHPSIADR